MPKKALVTGANGFTGSNLCRALVKHGYHVSALVRHSSNLEALRDMDVEIIHCDLAGKDLCPDQLEGVDIVFHLAAIYRRESVPVRYFYEVNVGGTLRMLEAAKSAGVERFVHCSTVGVLGEIKDPPATEEAPYNPGDEYQKSKVEAELLALDFFARYGLQGTVVRPCGIYGPGDLRFLKLFKGIDRRRFIMIGNGEVRYQMTYIDDLVEGIRLAGERQEAIGEVFILAGNEIPTVKQLVQMIARILGRPVPHFHLSARVAVPMAALCQKVSRPFGIEPPLYPRRLDFFLKNRAFDISKARNLLGYHPQVDLETGLKCTAEWYHQHHYL
jgi:nucleoside-diphosphate-sugar epimerase